MTSYYCIPVPYNEKDIFGGLLVLEGLVGFHGIIQLQFSFFSITGQGIDLDYCDTEWFALEMNRDHSLVFADCIKLLHFQCKEYNQSDFGVDHLVMSMCRVFSCVVRRGCLL